MKVRPQMREDIEEILSVVDATRGVTTIVSSQNPAGDQLAYYGDIIALLRYKVDFSEDMI